jgi:hypothetical protein
MPFSLPYPISRAEWTPQVAQSIEDNLLRIYNVTKQLQPKGSGNLGDVSLDGNTHHFLRGDGTQSEVNLGSADVTGLLPITSLALDGVHTHFLRGDGNQTQVDLSTSDVTNRLPFSKLAQGTALSVQGVTGNATADLASIVAASDFQVLRRSGTAVGFGAIDLSQSAAVTGLLAWVNLQNFTATSRILGRKSSGAGPAEECTLTEILDFVGSAAQGDILFRGASGWSRLPAGTATYVLATGGAGADPSWAPPSGGAVTGPGVSVDSEIVLFNGTSGGIIKRATGTGVVHATAGVFSVAQVTYAELQDVSATSRILARRTAGAGSVEENTLSQILDFIGSAAQGDILYRGASGWARLGAGTSGNLLQTNGPAADPSWVTPSSGTGDVAGPSSSVDSEVVLFSGTTGKVIKRATGTGIAHVTSGVLSASKVLYAEIQDTVNTARIIGRKSGGGGSVEECTLSETLDFIGSPAQGDLLYRDASAWARLPAGTSGQFLKTQGAAANPAWVTGLLPISGSGHPQGVVSAAIGNFYFDTVTGYVYRKVGGGSTAYGWYPVPEPSNVAGPLPFLMIPAIATASQAFGGATGYGGITGNAGVNSFTQSGTASKTTVNGKVFGVGTTTGAATVAKLESLTTNNQGLLADDIDIWAYLFTDPTAVTVTRIWFGWTTSGASDVNMAPTNTGTTNLMAIQYCSDGNAVWEGVCRSSAGTTGRSTTSTLGSIASNTAYVVRIRFVRQGGTPTAYFSVNDGTEQAVTGTNLPASGAACFLTLAIDQISGAVTKAIGWRAIGGAVGS